MKLIDKTEEKLQTQMQAVRKINDDTHMEFGLDKRKKFVLQRGKLVHSQNLIFHFKRKYQELEKRKINKYLGTEKSEGISYQQMIEGLKKEYIRRLRIILISELNTKNKITAIVALSVPFITIHFWFYRH